MTITDTLETLFKATGKESVTGSMRDIAGGADAVGEAHERMANKMRAAGHVATAVLAAVAAVAVKSLNVFAEDEQAIFRTTIVLRNLGNSFPIERAQEFASELQKTVAVDDEAIVSLIGLEKRFGIADDQIEATTKTIIDFAKGSGQSLEQAGLTIGRALIGQTRGLRAMGIEFKATGDKAKDLAKIQEKLNGLFGGAGAAERNTVTGSFTALRESLNNLLSAIGSQIATVLVPGIQALTRVIDKLNESSKGVTAALGAAGGAAIGGRIGLQFGGLKGAAIGAAIGGVAGAAAGFLPSRPNAAEQVGIGGAKLATEGTLAKIAENTAGINDGLVKAVLGGSGKVARSATNFRDFKMTFAA